MTSGTRNAVWIEDSWQYLSRHTLTRVDHFQHEFVYRAALPQADNGIKRDFALRRCEFYRVLQQVGDRLRQARWVNV